MVVNSSKFLYIRSKTYFKGFVRFLLVNSWLYFLFDNKPYVYMKKRIYKNPYVFYKFLYKIMSIIEYQYRIDEITLI